MAEDPKIVLDPPPVPPRDVVVNPDPPPKAPSDVPVYPDEGPRGTFEVPTYPDPGPRAPIDVAVSPDLPPRPPFDVPTSIDGPPWAPHDVQVSQDPGPADPVDVQTTLDGGPAAPIDVPTYPDSDPAAPFQVPTAPDGPPAVPFQVAITPDPPPAQPFQVPTYPDPSGRDVGGSPGDKPTIQQIVDAVGRFDHALGSFLNDLLEVNPISLSGPGGGALNPEALANWLKDYTSTVGGAGTAKFIAEQAVLYGMNPVAARIFDPSYFLKMLVPGSMGHVTTTVDVEAGGTLKAHAELDDQLLQVRVNSSLPGTPIGDGRVDTRGVYSPNVRAADGQDFSIDEMVDAAVDGTGHPFLKQDRNLAGVPAVKRFDASAYFVRDPVGAQVATAIAKFRASNAIENLQSREAALAASTFIDGVVRVPIGANEDPDGAVYSQTPDPTALVDDDDARVPLCFTDLRRDPARRAYRSVYFRPLNLSFSEALAPEYGDQGSFGRVDTSVSYTKTPRSFSLSFEVHAFAPEDLQVMYYKLHWLRSMCYPSYTPDGLFQSGPVIRMRIGDAVGSSQGGLGGVIRSLNVDFSDTLWELRKGMKVPRSYKVSMDFLALHDGPVGILNGVFGVLSLPVGGAAPDRDTNDPGGPGDARADVPPAGASVSPGSFSRFGEPRRR